MGKLTKILLPVDFSDRSYGAARYGRTLAHHFGSEVWLLHVMLPPHYEYASMEVGSALFTEFYLNRSEQIRKELADFAALEFAGCNVNAEVLEGDPARAIVARAHEEKVDLILMPTHGYGPFRRFILGSNTAKVLHDAECPVWTGVHMENALQAAEIPIRRIVCALDLGPESCRTLQWAADLQADYDAELTVIHATAAPDQERFLTVIRGEIAQLQARHSATAEVVIEPGEPARVVCAVAARMAADLLVIGRGSAGPVPGRLRTNAYAMIRESPCPVVSV